MIFGVDLTGLSPHQREMVHRVCSEDNARAMVQAKLRQQQTAKAFHDRPARHIEGIGQTMLSVDPFWNTYFKLRYGDRVMHDPEFRKFIQREDDMFRVRTTGARFQVGYRGGGGAGRKFRKVYA